MGRCRGIVRRNISGFAARSGAQGRGDSNGLIEGYNSNNGYVEESDIFSGETALFWE